MAIRDYLSRTPGAPHNARLRINSLNGGVGRQAPSKRLPNEAEEMDNVWVTSERSFEKRPPTETVPYTVPASPTWTGYSLPHATTGVGPFVYKWLEFAEDARYLVVFDLGVARSGANNLYWVYWLNGSGELVSHTPASQATNVSADTWAYIQHNVPSDPNELKTLSIGTDTLILNTLVKAGFSSTRAGDVLESGSTATGKKLFDRNGAETSTDDVDGRLIVYATSVSVDGRGESILWTRYSSYSAGTKVFVPADGEGAEDGVWRAKVDVTTDIPPTLANAATWESLYGVARINIEGNKYPDLSKPWLGQSVPTWADIKLPPLAGDDVADYGGPLTEATITSLYGSLGGKVWYTEGGYAGNPPGYYQVIEDTYSEDTNGTYLRRIRAPDSNGLLDKRRMPMRLRYRGVSGGVSQWTLEMITWDPRMFGDRDSNPGPSVFARGRQAAITSMAFYRNRLWLSARDTIFASKYGDYDNFFLDDPANITEDDTIDVAASYSKYVEVTDLLPFDSFLFVNTNGPVQFEIRGTDNNRISPLTVEVSPTSFYSTAPSVSPISMGSQIYYAGPRRLYMYIPNDAEINTSMEVSARCPEYLPAVTSFMTTAPNQDCILMVDSDIDSDIYLYVNRYLGTNLLQSSFFRWRLREAEDSTVSIRNIAVFGNIAYVTTHRSTDTKYSLRAYVEKVNLESLQAEYPWLDRKYSMTLDVGTADETYPPGHASHDNCEYDALEDETIFLLPFHDPAMDYIVLSSGWGDENNAVLKILRVETTNGLWSKVYVQGKYDEDGNVVTFGHSFLCDVELSPQFYRDDNQQVVDGVLSLRVMHCRHHNSGEYFVLAKRQGKPTDTVETIAYAINDGTDFSTRSYTARFYPGIGSAVIPTPYVNANGEIVAQIMSLAEDVEIHIASASPGPLNITNIELSGIFRTTMRSVPRG